MDLIKLKERKEELEVDIKSYKKKIKRQRQRLEPKATNLKKEIVKGTPKRKTIEDVMHKIIEMEKNIKLCKEELDDIHEEIKAKEEIYEKYNDRDKSIYIDKKLNKYSNAKISYKYGLGKRQINKIVKKVEKNTKSSP